MKKSLLVFLTLFSALCYSQVETVLKSFNTEEISINPLIKGTVYLPLKQNKKTNLVLLIAGSGPTDRDGNQKGITNNSLKYVSEELAKNDIVLLYDFFHFIFQSQILISKSDYKSIYEVIVTLIKNNSRLKDIVQKYNIDINENYKLYLLYTVSYYLDKYNNQEKLHDQVFWLIDVWFDAFNDLVDKKGQTFE